MALKLTNITLDKEIYVFWEDKEIKIKFDFISENESSIANSIIIKYWVNIYLGWKKYLDEIESIVLGEDINLDSNIPKSFEFSIPIKYPNVWDKKIEKKFDENKDENEYDFDSYVFNNNIKLRNYIEIFVDKKLSLFDCKKEILPKVHLKCEINTTEISWKESLFNLEKYKNNPNYVNIWWGVINKEYITKNFYTFLKNNYKSYKFIDFIRINFKYFSITFFLITLISLGLTNKVNNIWIIYLWVLIFCFLILVYIRRSMRTIKNSVIDIRFKDKKIIEQAILEKDNISVEDIYENIWINYDWIYNCKVKLYISSLLSITNKEKSWKHTRYVQYNKTINLYELWNYSWNDLTLKNIIKLESGLKNNIVPIKYFWKIPIYRPWRWSARIIYKLFYKFESPELIDNYWEIIIWWAPDKFNTFLNKLIWN